MLLGQDSKQRYNDFVAACEYGDFMQSWEWGELKSRTGWQPYRLAIEEGGRISAAVQVLKRPVPGLGRCLLYSPRGPLYDLSRPRLFELLLEQVNALAREHGAMAYKIDPAIPQDNSAYLRTLRDHDFSPAPIGDEAFGGIQPRYVMQVDVTPSEDEILARFKSKWRYNVRLAERKGITISSDCPREQVAVFYRLLLETAERDGFKVRAESYFIDLYDLLIAAGLGGLFIARLGDEPVAAAISLTIGKCAWYVYGASSNRHRNKMPNHLMQWEMMRWAKARGCQVYDLRGVARENDKASPLYGLNRFKEGFAARYVEYIGEWDQIYSPIWYRLFNIAEPTVRKLRLLLAGLKK